MSITNLLSFLLYQIENDSDLVLNNPFQIDYDRLNACSRYQNMVGCTDGTNDPFSVVCTFLNKCILQENTKIYDDSLKVQQRQVGELQSLYSHLKYSQLMNLNSYVEGPQLQNLLIDVKVDQISDKMTSLVSVDFNNLAPCYYATEEAFFNLGGIMDGSTDGTQQVAQIAFEDITLQFNFCEDPLPSVKFGDVTCDASDSFAFVSDETKCEGLKAPDSDTANTVAVQINNPDSPSDITGIGLYYMSTDYSLWVNITCDADKDQLEFSGTKNGNNYAIYATHKTGCPTIQYSLIYKFLTKYSYLWGAVIIALGLVFCFAGNALINGILFLTGAIISFGALSYATFAILEHLDKSPSETVQWVIVGVCGVAGVLLGLLVKKIRPLGIGALAAWGGVVLGLLITTTFVVSNQYAKWGTIAACAFALGYTAFRVEKIVIIGVTSMIGSYMILRGISMYAGGFPNENYISEEIRQGAITWESFPKSFYGYLGGILACAIIGAVVQVNQNVHKDNYNKSR